jgi:hypothetical protein
MEILSEVYINCTIRIVYKSKVSYCTINGCVTSGATAKMLDTQQWVSYAVSCLESYLLTYLLTYLLISYLRSWALPEKLPIVQPLKNFPAF